MWLGCFVGGFVEHDFGIFAAVMETSIFFGEFIWITETSDGVKNSREGWAESPVAGQVREDGGV